MNKNKPQTKKRKSLTPEKTNNKDNNVFNEKYFNPNENFSKYMRDHRNKKGIVFTSRVHPGESNASFVAGTCKHIFILF